MAPARTTLKISKEILSMAMPKKKTGGTTVEIRNTEIYSTINSKHNSIRILVPCSIYGTVIHLLRRNIP